MTSLYIHIPFCEQKCFYCSFVVSVGQRHRVDDYLDCLSLEARRYQGTECASVFLGGGTPSYLEADQLKRLFKIVEENFSVASDAEYTIEANPESLGALKPGEDHRVLFGLQIIVGKLYFLRVKTAVLFQIEHIQRNMVALERGEHFDILFYFLKGLFWEAEHQIEADIREPGIADRMIGIPRLLLIMISSQIFQIMRME